MYSRICTHTIHTEFLQFDRISNQILIYFNWIVTCTLKYSLLIVILQVDSHLVCTFIDLNLQQQQRTTISAERKIERGARARAKWEIAANQQLMQYILKHFIAMYSKQIKFIFIVQFIVDMGRKSIELQLQTSQDGDCTRKNG